MQLKIPKQYCKNNFNTVKLFNGYKLKLITTTLCHDFSLKCMIQAISLNQSGKCCMTFLILTSIANHFICNVFNFNMYGFGYAAIYHFVIQISATQINIYTNDH